LIFIHKEQNLLYLKIGIKKFLKLKDLSLLFLLRKLFNFKRSKVNFYCISGSDGGGAQLQRIISVIALSEYFGQRFIHQDLVAVDFNQTGMSKIDTVNKWNYLIDFSHYIESNTDSEINTCNKKCIKGIFQSLLFSQNLCLNNAYRFLDLKPESYNLAIRNIRLNNSIKSDNTYIHISVRNC